MRAATIVDGAIVVADHPDPVPGAGEVLVRVRAAGLNRADLLQMMGFYPAPPGNPPDIPGLELAGEVVGVGPRVLTVSPGDRVMAVVGGGGQAELVVVQERTVMPMPEGVDWVQGGAIPEAVTTAHDALFTQCGLAMSDRVCISGGAGGVGTAAVILAAAAGARVTATVRNPDLRAAVAALGAEAVAPEEMEDRGPYDVILELVGAPNLPADVRALATGGRISVIGVGAGAAAELDLLGLMSKRGTIRGSTLRARPLEQRAEVARRVEANVLPLFAGGRRQVPVAATYALEEATTAYAHFAAGGNLGKTVLTIPGG